MSSLVCNKIRRKISNYDNTVSNDLGDNLVPSTRDSTHSVCIRKYIQSVGICEKTSVHLGSSLNYTWKTEMSGRGGGALNSLSAKSFARIRLALEASPETGDTFENIQRLPSLRYWY